MQRHPYTDPFGITKRQHLRHQFAQTVLADRFDAMVADTEMVDDSLALACLQALSIARKDSIGDARSYYEQLRAGHDEMPEFETLFADGSLRTTGGHVAVALPLVSERREKTPLYLMMRELSTMLSTTWRAFPDSYPGREEPLAIRLSSDDSRRPTIRTRTPAWVAARLWEACANIDDPVSRLSHWHDRWLILGSPPMVPSTAWSPADAGAFVDAVFAALDEPGALLAWTMVAGADRMLRPFPFSRQHPGNGQACSLLDSYLALSTSGDGMFRLAMIFPLHGVVRCLLAEVDASANAGLPHPIIERMVPIVRRSPEVLAALMEYIDGLPRLYADLLGTAFAATAAVQLTNRRDTRFPSVDTLARQDTSLHIAAVGVMLSDLVGEVTVPDASDETVTEFAALAAYAFDRASTGLSNANLLLDNLRPRLHTLPAAASSRLVDALLPTMGNLDTHTGAFSAILEIVGHGQAPELSCCESIVACYTRAMGGNYNARAVQALDARPASTLARMALASSRKTWGAFANATDVKGRLSAKGRSGEPRLVRSRTAGRALRDHIRLLARAVTGWPGRIPGKLAQALANAIIQGSSDNGRLRVDAFTVDHGQLTFGSPEAPLAPDLAAALNRTSGASHTAILHSLCEIAEPAVLSTLHELVPLPWQPGLTARLEVIEQTGASELWTFTAVIERARQLAAGGHYASATAVLDTLDGTRVDRVRGASTSMLYLRLDIAYHQGDGDTILEWALPNTASDPDRDALAHFQGLVWLSRRDGGRPAESIYLRLARQRPDVGGYHVNLLAARLSLFLSDDLFGRVPPDLRDEANAVLVQTGETQEVSSSWPAPQRDSFLFNRALLLMAMDEPDASLLLLDAISDDRSLERLTGYRAVALHRLGRDTSATDRLRMLTASGESGELAKAALAHITQGRPFAGVAAFANAAEAMVYKGLAGFRTLPPPGQLRVWHGGVRSEEEIVLADVRAAGVQMSELSVLLRARPKALDDWKKLENDLTSLLRALLIPRAHFFGWMWNEQSQGGITVKENPGKRDLALMQGDTVHTVLEAVICDEPTTTLTMQGELMSHLQRLFGYATCETLYFVVYSYRDDPDEVTRYLFELARKRGILPGLTLDDVTPLPVEGTLVPGFVARYRITRRRVNVYFLVIDMAREFAREAGAEAHASNPRNSSRPRDRPPNP